MNWNPKLLRFRGARWVAWGLALAIALPLAWQRWRDLQPYNGFDVSAARIDAQRIDAGGPGRDGIPALTDPPVLAAGEAGFLRDEDVVIGLVQGGQARAYPIKILNWHEVVNDRLGGQAVAVTYCPLCGTGVAFAALLGGERLDFGVSGLLYQDNLLLYDRATKSLWSQFMGQAVSGPRSGTTLAVLPVEHLPWPAWRARHPGTTVLALPRGVRRDYDVDPYREYRLAPRPAGGAAGALAPNAWVIGLVLGGQARAWPLATLALRSPVGQLQDRLGDVALRIDYDSVAATASVRGAGGELLPATLSYWFAWQAFHPGTSVWQAAGGGPGAASAATTGRAAGPLQPVRTSSVLSPSLSSGSKSAIATSAAPLR